MPVHACPLLKHVNRRYIRQLVARRHTLHDYLKPRDYKSASNQVWR